MDSYTLLRLVGLTSCRVSLAIGLAAGSSWSHALSELKVAAECIYSV